MPHLLTTHDDNSSTDSDESHYFQDDKTNIAEWLDADDDESIFKALFSLSLQADDNSIVSNSSSVKDTTTAALVLLSTNYINNSVNAIIHNTVDNTTRPSDIIVTLAIPTDVVHNKIDIVDNLITTRDVVYHNTKTCNMYNNDAVTNNSNDAVLNNLPPNNQNNINMSANIKHISKHHDKARDIGHHKTCNNNDNDDETNINHNNNTGHVNAIINNNNNINSNNNDDETNISNNNKTDLANVTIKNNNNFTNDNINSNKVTDKNTVSIIDHYNNNQTGIYQRIHNRHIGKDHDTDPYDKKITDNLVLQSTDPEIDAILQPVRDARKLIPQKKSLRTLKTVEAVIVAHQSD